jgi:hypothetical protein
MSTTNQFQRTVPLVSPVELGKANNGIGNAINTILRSGATLTNIKAYVRTAFDGSGTVTLTVTDGTTTFINAQSVKTASATTPLTNADSDNDYPTGGTIQAYITDQNSDSTKGQVVVKLFYEDGKVVDIYDNG